MPTSSSPTSYTQMSSSQKFPLISSFTSTWDPLIKNYKSETKQQQAIFIEMNIDMIIAEKRPQTVEATLRIQQSQKITKSEIHLICWTKM